MSGLFALLSWAAGVVAKSPATWIALAGLWAWWALGAVLGPVGVATASLRHEGPAYELAFVAATTGVALTLGPVRRARWALERVEPWHRAGLEFTLLVAGGAVGVVAGLLPEWLFGPAHGPEGALSWVGSALGLLHLAALGRLVGLSRLPGALEPALLVVLAWVVPAAVSGPGLPARAVDGMLDAARSWSSAEPVDLLRTLAAVLALTLTEEMASSRPRPATVPAR